MTVRSIANDWKLWEDRSRTTSCPKIVIIIRTTDVAVIRRAHRYYPVVQCADNQGNEEAPNGGFRFLPGPRSLGTWWEPLMGKLRLL